MRSKEQYEEKEELFQKKPLFGKFEISFFQGLDLFMTDRCTYMFEWRRRENKRAKQSFKIQTKRKKKPFHPIS